MKIDAVGVRFREYAQMTDSDRLSLILSGRNGLRSVLEALTIPQCEILRENEGQAELDHGRTPKESGTPLSASDGDVEGRFYGNIEELVSERVVPRVGGNSEIAEIGNPVRQRLPSPKAPKRALPQEPREQPADAAREIPQLSSQDSDSVDENIPTEIFSQHSLSQGSDFEGPGPGGALSGPGSGAEKGDVLKEADGSEDGGPDIYSSLHDPQQQGSPSQLALSGLCREAGSHGPALPDDSAEMLTLICGLASKAGELQESQSGPRASKSSKRAFPRLTHRYLRYLKVRDAMGREQRRNVLLETVHEEEVQRMAEMRIDLLEARATNVKRVRVGFEDVVFPVNNFHYAQNRIGDD